MDIQEDNLHLLILRMHPFHCRVLIQRNPRDSRQASPLNAPSTSFQSHFSAPSPQRKILSRIFPIIPLKPHLSRHFTEMSPQLVKVSYCHHLNFSTINSIPETNR